MKRMSVFLLILALPLFIQAACYHSSLEHWSRARWDRTYLAPDPGEHPEPIVQVYSARAWGWKGVVASHTWIVFKRAGSADYERYEVVGWGTRHGYPAVRHNLRPIDGYWAGNRPEVIADFRGPQAAGMIEKIEAAVASYPHHHTYLTWPGPNSNTFTAYVLRQVPELHAEMPPEAIGRSFLGTDALMATAPSGSGVTVSLLGLTSLTVAAEEGLELELLGFAFGIDVDDAAFILPGLGELSLLNVVPGADR